MATDLKAWLAQGPFTLALSSSFFGFYAHCGIVTAMDEAGLHPSKITGSSAGALIGGGLASGLSPRELKELLFSVKRDDFWDPQPGLGVLRGEKFLNILQKNFTSSFEDAAIPLEVAVLDVLSMKTKYLKSGALPLAVAASCAVPVMFHPVKIDGRWLYDGGVLDKAAVQSDKIDERILGVYLETPGWSGIYERKKLIRKLSPHHKVAHFRNLPRVSFYSLAGRQEAFEEGYRRARQVLANPAGDFSVKG